MVEEIKKINIAIDGPSGVGKSSIAQALAQKLNYVFINTGSLYRGLALKYLEEKWTNEQLLDNLKFLFFKYDEGGNLWLNNIVLDNNIRTIEISNIASKISQLPKVREFINSFILSIIKNGKGYILEGRDTTFKIAPDAELRIFLSANVSVRAKRRLIQNNLLDNETVFENVLNDVKKRDIADSSREIDPLHVAPGVVELDNTDLDFEQTLNRIIELYYEKIKK